MFSDDDFSIGIEEEYLLVDQDTLDLAPAPEAMMKACQSYFGGQVSPEFLQCQIEIGTRPFQNIKDARDDLRHLRAGIQKEAHKHGLAPIAVSCHPFADWRKQHHTPKARYDGLRRDLGGVARRMLICGMHVHVGIESPEARIDIMNQMGYFLPHLLALSASSPFWNGEDTGLASYRLSVFDNLPRTGLPPRFDSWESYEPSTHSLVELDLIEETSKIWWDVRPSSRYPTLETRICDVSPRLERSLTLAAIIQCLARFLYRLRTKNQRWRIYDNFLLAENRWRAQRFGTSDTLIDFGRRALIPYAELLDELIKMLSEDAEALGCLNEIERAREWVSLGSASDQQRAVYQHALTSHNSQEAMREVVRHLMEEYSRDL